METPLHVASQPVGEQDLRRHLGIPTDAGHVLILAESSHWDPDWLHTAEEYFTRYVRRNLDQAIAELLREPRRIYSVECIFFLRQYWERCPEQRDNIRTLINAGRLRLTSSGVTTADTLLPSAEAILRDFLLGQEWLRANGMDQEPRLAYFPDSFGCSHALPTLLNAAGFDQAALTRLDGMLFPGCDFPFKSQFQWAGSTAALLLEEKRTLDFIWRDSQGGEVLCHWNAYTYAQGDMLAHSGVARVYLFPLAFPNRSAGHVARRIAQYVRQLLPCSRTPYLFCPIGFDFVGPIPDLLALLDRYNRAQYPETGIWVVNAGLDDYLALINCHRERLPVLQIDPNPYWTGFYTSRPSLKKRCHELVDALLLAEQLALRPENAGSEQTVAREIAGAWWNAVVANHHDFITGTSPDPVVEREQRPWLEQGVEVAATAIARLEEKIAGPASSSVPQFSGETPAWREHDGVIEIHTPYYGVELAAEAGGSIVRGWEPSTGQALLTSPSGDLLVYQDSGGLWRMGHEFIGGTWRLLDRSSRHPVQLQVHEGNGFLEVTCTVSLEGNAFTRRLWFRNDTPIMHLQVEGRAAPRRTVVLRFETQIETDQLAMDEPGGVIVRPGRKKYEPTFWPLQSFVHLQDSALGRSLALLLGMPGAVAYRAGGRLEVVTHRNAIHEKAFRFVTFPGLPVRGHEHPVHAAHYGLLFTPAGNWLANELPQVAQQALRGPGTARPWRARFSEIAGSWIEVNPSGVFVGAIKPASRGRGLIVRLVGPGRRGQSVTLSLRGREIQAAYLCDARERDLQELAVQAGTVYLAMPGSIATVRLL